MASPDVVDLRLDSSIATRVAEQLHDEIRRGLLPAGSPLRQNDIAARLGVSSTPVREAFHALERMGLVQRDARRGVRVFRPSVQDLLHSYDIRAALEALAARQAVTQLTDTDLAGLTQVLDRMDAGDVGYGDFMDLNASFHNRIAEASGNRRLAELIANEQTAAASYVVFLGVDRPSRTAAAQEHRAILAALRARDADEAARLMRVHSEFRSVALQERLVATESDVSAGSGLAAGDREG